jgi:DNA invertase Pin-like site-specific DNA recombinase
MGIFSEAVIGFLATIGRFEAERISCRVRAGLDRARSEGKCLGRPMAIVDRDRLVEMRQSGLPIRDIAVKVGRSPMTVQRLLKEVSVYSMDGVNNS